ncbi:hypothetical protein IT882_11430 [Microbacterium schleiferi]|uniref:Uncharacterized protein n=1 Tax=Microbacterium schleiferi TaxID=69362 RepID=A0A7S8MV97_9MICO|nr:hypothetical protein [Microbacterium schleiferi]QPE03869.1 hypothetical protein IT882_11430 [Microbacterium schleiferi]
MSSPDERQRVERVPGSRRARLTPAPGTDVAPESPDADADAPSTPPSSPTGPNDDRLRADVPPHY